MDVPTRDQEDLELALLRHGVDVLSAESERCAKCHRTPLIGERVYTYGSGVVMCELCRVEMPEAPTESRLIHGPEFGHTMRIVDQRAVA
ncbi:MAG TPA: hypothetical protein VGI87_03280 [Solirubrobacteraceae bacterium]|jgi:hypothetical protein